MDFRLHYHDEEESMPTIELPSSKSIANRALIINALSERSASIEGSMECEDTQAIIGALKGGSQGSGLIVDIGAAGTAMRFLTGYFAATPGVQLQLTGTERMRRRPISPLVEALRDLGGEIDYVEAEGYPPLAIHGSRLKGGQIAIRGDVSSQFISALMMIGATLAEGLTICLLGDVLSRPYIDMTAQMMRQWGVDVQIEADRIVVPSQRYVAPSRYLVEADWSSASYIYEMVALTGNRKVKVKGLVAGTDSLQGDSATAELYAHFGVTTKFCDGYAILSRGGISSEGELRFNLSATPDIVPSLVVTSCLLGRHFHFEGVDNLRIKECDRLVVMQEEMRKIGYELKVDERSISWKGQRCEASCAPSIKTHHDHRIAMSFAPAVVQQSGLVVEDAMVVRKSFPHFWSQMRQMGITTEEI